MRVACISGDSSTSGTIMHCLRVAGSKQANKLEMQRILPALCQRRIAARIRRSLAKLERALHGLYQGET